jgi:hypothetical protein
MTTSTGYAEMFEWADGNRAHEDRAGYTVVFDGPESNKIRIAKKDDTPFGVVAGDNTSVEFISGASAHEWHGKHIRDPVGRLKWQPQRMVEWVDKGYRHWYEEDRVPAGLKVPPDAKVYDTYPDGRPMLREILTPDYDDGSNGGNLPTYLPRFERPEWAIVVILGRVHIREQSPYGPNWIRLSGTKIELGRFNYSYLAEYLIR